MSINRKLLVFSFFLLFVISSVYAQGQNSSCYEKGANKSFLGNVGCGVRNSPDGSKISLDFWKSDKAKVLMGIALVVIFAQVARWWGHHKNS